MAIRAALADNPNHFIFPSVADPPGAPNAITGAGCEPGARSDTEDVMEAVLAAATNHALAASEPAWVWHARLLPRALSWIRDISRSGTRDDAAPAAALRLMQLAMKQLDHMAMLQSDVTLNLTLTRTLTLTLTLPQPSIIP